MVAISFLAMCHVRCEIINYACLLIELVLIVIFNL